MAAGDGAAVVLGVIPARFGARRFPGKPLAPLWGKPLLQHVWERAARVRGIDRLLVATEDDRIAEAARGFGAEVVMTSTGCPTGTDRVAEVALARPEAEILVNLQGDEPELDAEATAELVRGMREDSGLLMATLAHREADPRFLAAPDVVKVGVDAGGFALYFSRMYPMPGAPGVEALRHVGVYGFRRGLLLEFAAWPPGRLEQAERLEQLRALERGVRIRVFASGQPAMGVDTPEQLARLERRGPRP